MVNIKQIVWEPIKYLVFLIYVMRAKQLHTFRIITKCSYRSFKYPNEESGKIFKTQAAEPYTEPCQIYLMEHFCENTTTKTSSSQMFGMVLNTTLRFFNECQNVGENCAFHQYGPCRRFLLRDIPRYQKQQLVHVLLNSP